jgi:hypothetical protein
MASPAQIAANRLNALKSTGPSPAGLAVTRFNALKSGIDAKSQVIPGEDPAEFEALAENYRRQFQPATPSEVCLVDALTTADWELRRLRKIVAVIWDERAFLRPESPEAKRLDRLNRRLDAAERSYYRALKELKKRALTAQYVGQHAEQQAEPAAAPPPEPEASELASFPTGHIPAPFAIVAPPPAPQSRPQMASESPAKPNIDPKVNLCPASVRSKLR